jgi:hypothetical protein
MMPPILKRWLALVFLGLALLLAQQGAWRHDLVHTAQFLQEPRRDAEHHTAIGAACDQCLAFSASAHAVAATGVLGDSVHTFAEWRVHVAHTPRVAQTWVCYRSRAPPAFA